MPKAHTDGPPSYAGHVNTAPHLAEPEWVPADQVPAEPVVEPAAKPVEDKPAAKADHKSDTKRPVHRARKH